MTNLQQEEKENREEIVWNKMNVPLVTICCHSLNYNETSGGTWCLQCRHLIKDNGLRRATPEDLGITQEEFNSAYNVS